MKVHITLSDSVFRDSAAREKLLKQITTIGDLTGVNRKRLEKYGIVSGDVASAEVVGKLRELEGVENVSLDTVRRAL